MGTCIFCGEPFGAGRKSSREHIWPEWMHELLPEQAPAMLTRGSTGTGLPNLEQLPMGGLLQKKVKPRVVCQPCNNGWMSELETATKPILRPLILGEGKRLTRARQRTLAEWFCLKNMVLAYSAPEGARVASDAERAAFCADRTIPPRTQMWIGEHVGEEWGVRHLHYTLRRGSEPIISQPPYDPVDAFEISTLATGRVLFHLIRVPIAHINPEPAGEFTQRVRRIHPFVKPIDWPIGLTLTDKGAAGLAISLLGWLATNGQLPAGMMVFPPRNPNAK